MKQENPDEKENRLKKDEIKKKFKDIDKEIKKDNIDIKQLYQWFKEEIERKDKEIIRLKKDNDILFKTAIKARSAQLSVHESKKVR